MVKNNQQSNFSAPSALPHMSPDAYDWKYSESVLSMHIMYQKGYKYSYNYKKKLELT